MSIEKLKEKFDVQCVGDQLLIHEGGKNVLAATREDGKWTITERYQIALGMRPAPEAKPEKPTTRRRRKKIIPEEHPSAETID